MNEEKFYCVPRNYKVIKELHKSERNFVLLVRDVNGGKAVCKIMQGNHEVYDHLRYLKHPSLPDLFYVDAGESQTVIVEEYIEGVPIDKAGLTTEGIVEKLTELCDVLDFLHKKDVIHRDIKEHHILIPSDGRGIKLIDFDIARIYKEEMCYDTEVRGTRGYASPEHFGFGQTDSRSDIYSLGHTLRSLLEDRDEYPNYSEIVKKCMEVKPADRFESALALKAALQRGTGNGESHILKNVMTKTAKTVAVSAGGSFLGNVLLTMPVPAILSPVVLPIALAFMSERRQVKE